MIDLDSLEKSVNECISHKNPMFAAGMAMMLVMKMPELIEIVKAARALYGDYSADDETENPTHFSSWTRLEELLNG